MKEVLYFIKEIAHRQCEVAKFVDGADRPEQLYRIVDNQCQCWQAVARKKECRHLVMKREWEKRGRVPLCVDYEKGEYTIIETE